MNSVPRRRPEICSLLPPDLAADIGAVAAALQGDGHELRAWVNPGPNFERIITISDERDLDGTYGISVCQRYRPRDAVVCVVAADIRPSHAEDDLRLAVEAARERDPYRAHWLLAYRPAEPLWSVRFAMGSPNAARAAMRTTATRARERAEPHYLYSSQEQLICANNPAAEGKFFSVTPERRWSAHDRNETLPLAGQPGMVALGFRPSISDVFAALGADGRRRERGAAPQARPTHRIGR
jgi:hypothetical protein